jgi:phage tail sheath protein FI
MAEYLAPGVYVEEKDLKPPAIEAVSTSTTGMVGHAQRGPTKGPPVLVTNMLQFRQAFGGPLPASAGTVGEMFYAAQGFFANGGRRLYVMRAAAAGAAATIFQTRGGMITRLAVGADAAVGAPNARLASTMGLRSTTSLTFSFIKDGIAYTSSARAIAAGGLDPVTGNVTLAANLDIAPAGPTAYPAAATTVATGFAGLNAAGVPQAGARPNSIKLMAAETGTWGDGIALSSRRVVAARGVVSTVVTSAVDNNQIRLLSAAGFYPNAWVQVDVGPNSDKMFRKVTAVSGSIVTLAGPAVGTLAPVAPATQTVLTVQEFAISASYDGVTEDFGSLTLENVPGKYVFDQIKQRSNLLAIDPLVVPGDTNPLYFPTGDDGLMLLPTTAGVDAAPAAADIRGTDGGPGNRTGLRALEEIDDISIIVAPGWGDASVQGAMIEQCERLRYRVALLDPDASAGPPTLTGIQTQRLQFDTKYAAIYFPRIIIRDADDQSRAIGPAGHMAGLCARIDNERGVYKSPGNEVLRNLTDLEVIVTKGEHEVLNPQPNNINVIRDLRREGLGIRIYGARCITSLADWKYLAVRRLFIAIERSIELGTQWAVLEPNDPRLWDRLVNSVDSFLSQQWREGALLGVKKEDAFYVRCGTTTMTQNDIDNGRLVMEVGIAPVKPAEIVVFSVSQYQPEA